MQDGHSHAICGAKTRSGGVCQNWAMANGRCRMHGGKVPRGAALPQFKHGRYSKAIPARMLQAYEAAANDPELLDLRQSVALIDARLIDLLAGIDAGETVGRWQAMRKAYYAFRAALQAHDDPGMVRAISAMEDLISRGVSEAEAWGEIRGLLDDRRKHTETQQKLETAGERGIPASELVTFMAALQKLIESVVPDPATRIRIGDGVEQLLTQRSTRVQ